jgi:hypothetical protein
MRDEIGGDANRGARLAAYRGGRIGHLNDVGSVEVASPSTIADGAWSPPIASTAMWIIDDLRLVISDLDPESITNR